MKRIIIINVFLLIIFAVLTAAFSFILNLNNTWNIIEKYIVYVHLDGDITDAAKQIDTLMPQSIIYEISIGIAAVIDLVAIIFIDFPLIKKWLNARKEARATAKAERTEANKQARIEALQNELDQLKKDE